MNNSSSLRVGIKSTVAVLALAAVVWIVYGLPLQRQPAGPPEKLTLAVNSSYIGTGLVFVALDRHYFETVGLHVTIQPYSSGRDALAAVLEGKADIATAAETPIMFAAVRGQPIAIIATIATSRREHGIVARRDRGISTDADLKGKKVATTTGTTAHYLLEAALLGSKLRSEDVQIVSADPPQIVEAIASGSVDAISTWEPFVTRARQALGKEGVVLDAEGIYVSTFNLAGQRTFIKQHPVMMQKLLQAMVRAEQFASEKPAEK